MHGFVKRLIPSIAIRSDIRLTVAMVGTPQQVHAVRVAQ